MTATGCLLLYTLGDDDELEITAKLEITVHPQRFKESYQFYAFLNAISRPGMSLPEFAPRLGVFFYFHLFHFQ